MILHEPVQRFRRFRRQLWRKYRLHRFGLQQLAVVRKNAMLDLEVVPDRTIRAMSSEAVGLPGVDGGLRGRRQIAVRRSRRHLRYFALQIRILLGPKRYSLHAYEPEHVLPHELFKRHARYPLD